MHQFFDVLDQVLSCVVFQIVIADIFSAESLAPHFPGCDSVISCLGTHTMFSTVTLYSESIQVITEAMKRADCKRLVVISSWWTRSMSKLEVNPAFSVEFVYIEICFR